MDTLIRLIGCFVLTCILFACPVCLTLIYALPWDGTSVGFDKIKSFAAVVLTIVCIAEFGWVFWYLI